MIVVADTSPLNYLILIGQIDLLPVLYGRIAIPSSVHLELMHSGAPSLVCEWIEHSPPWLQVLTPRPTIDPALLNLDAGEREAITLAEEIAADLLVVDELRGRRIAEARGLDVIGTLGVLRDAAALGLIDLSDSLERLSKTSFHLSPALLRRLQDDRH